MKTTKHLAILGVGGFAEEVFFHVRDAFADMDIVFVDDFFREDTVELAGKRYPVLKDWDFTGRNINQFLPGAGSPKNKKILVKKALDAGLVPADTFVHPRALVQNATLGKGGVICPGVVVTTNVAIGDYVTLNLNCTIGHDTILKDFVTCNPTSAVSGNCALGQEVLLGVGATTKEGISIAANTIIGAQSFVSKDVTEEGMTLVGVPARVLRR